MNAFQKTLKNPIAWTFAVGGVIGAVSVTTIRASSLFNSAYAQSHVARSASSLSGANMEPLRALDSSLKTLAAYVEPAVVNIRSESAHSADVFGRAMAVGGEGSGVIYRPDGYIITNDHVVGGFEKVTVVLKDGREFPGKVTRAQDSDIAIVKIDAKDLPTLSFADSSKVLPGQISMAIGSPFGFENSVTIGHISALDRTDAIADPHLRAQRTYFNLLQTDTPINMGNSGGPLVDVDGEVIGINTAIYSQTGGSNGIGFAIPSNQVRLIADMLIQKGKVTRSFLGVAPVNLKEYQKKEMNLSGGALVLQVPNDGPAALAGIQAKDVITRIGTYAVNDQMDVRNAMLTYAPGTKVKVEYIRNGAHKTTEVTLTEPKPVAALPLQQQMPNMPEDPSQLFKQFGSPNGAPQAPSPSEPHTGNAKLGVRVANISEAERSQFGIPSSVKGALVIAVEPGSPAERLGLSTGDIVEKLDGRTITGADDVVAAMKDMKWGANASITFGRYSPDGYSQTTATISFK